MILMQKKSFLEGLNSLGSGWYFVGMYGEMPETQPNLSMYELIKHGTCIFEGSSEIRNDNHLKFLNVGSLLPYKGVANTAGLFGFEHHIMEVSYKDADQDGLSFIKFLANEDKINLDTGESITYNLDRETTINTLHVDSPLPLSEFLVQVEVEGVWETLGEVDNKYLETFKTNQIVSKFRLMNISTNTQSVGNVVTAHSDNRPIDASVPATIEWCLMVPKDPSSAQSAFGSDTPYSWLKCSGPNDGAMCIVNNANPNSGEEVRLLYLTLQPAIVEF